MKRWSSRGTAVLVLAAAIGIILPRLAGSQQPRPVERKTLHREDLPIAGWEAILATIELPPGSSEERHTHPAGAVYGFVEEGDVRLEVEGQPTRRLHKGDAFAIPLGKIHRGINDGTATAKLTAVFVAEKGKPLRVPVDESGEKK